MFVGMFGINYCCLEGVVVQEFWGIINLFLPLDLLKSLVVYNLLYSLLPLHSRLLLDNIVLMKFVLCM